MKKTVNEFLNLPYTIVIIPDEDNYFIKIKELKGCFSQGSTIEEAYEMIKDAMVSWLEVSLEEDDEIPLPESMQETNYSGKLSLRMPKSLHKKIANEAKEEGVSINSYIVSCLSENNAINKLTKIIVTKLSTYEKRISNEFLANSSTGWFSTEGEEDPETYSMSRIVDLQNKTNELRTIN